MGLTPFTSTSVCRQNPQQLREIPLGEHSLNKLSGLESPSRIVKHSTTIQFRQLLQLYWHWLAYHSVGLCMHAERGILLLYIQRFKKKCNMVRCRVWTFRNPESGIPYTKLIRKTNKQKFYTLQTDKWYLK